MLVVSSVVADDRIAEQHRRRLDSFRAVFEKVVRILTGEPVRVALVANMDQSLKSTPGWTDSKTIYLNAPLIQQHIAGRTDSQLVSYMASLTGLVYHETCHILYTPREGNEPTTSIARSAETNDRLWHAYNILEDQRIETLFWTQYEIVASYFSVTIAQWILANKRVIGDTFPLLHGRRYLPAKLREEARRQWTAMHGTVNADAIAKCIDEYVNLNPLKRPIQAEKIVIRFSKLIGSAVPDLQPTTGNHDKAPIRKPYDARMNSKPGDEEKLKDRNEQASQDLKEMDDSDSNDDADGKADSGGSPDSSATPPSDKSDADSAGKGQQDGSDGSAGRTGDPGESTDDDYTGSGRGAGQSTTSKGRDKSSSMEGMVKEMLDELLDDDALVSDVEDTIASAKAHLNRANRTPNIDDKKAQRNGAPVSDSARIVARRGADTLRRIRAELEPEWSPARSGRVDIGAAARHAHNSADLSFFEEYEPGAEELAGIEMVVAMDLSSSMNARPDTRNAYNSNPTAHQSSMQALWAIKEMCRLADIPCSVYGFGATSTRLYGACDRMDSNRVFGYDLEPDTVPEMAVKECRRQLEASQKPLRVFVVLTDGQWGNPANAEAQIAAMNASGYTTVMVSLSDNRHALLSHGCLIHRRINNASELSKVVEKVVATLSRQVLVQ